MAPGQAQTVCLRSAAARMLGRIAVAAQVVRRPGGWLCVSIWIFLSIGWLPSRHPPTDRQN